MAKSVSIISVFVASPSDVSEERDGLEDVIRELNLLWSRSKNIRLELIRWETHSYPSIGDSPQSVISDQIGDDYDIFIGILWKKFGTPTTNAESGTEEEFNRAFDRYQKDPTRLRILFYFKNAPIELNEIDLEQLRRVKQFKDQLGPKGTLYWEYRGKEDFLSFLRLHLTRHIENWGQEWGDIKSSASITTDMEQPEEEPGEEGYLDYIELAVNGFNDLKEQGQRMAQYMESLTAKVSERTQELEDAQAAPGHADLKLLKHICNHTAMHFDQYAEHMETEVPFFAGTFNRTIDAFSHATLFMFDFVSEGTDIRNDLSMTKKTISDLHITLINLNESMNSFRQSIGSQPRMTSSFNRAKRRALIVIDNFIDEIVSGMQRLEESDKTLQSLLDKLKD